MLSKRNSKYYEIGKLKVKDKEVFLININQILIKKRAGHSISKRGHEEIY